MPLLSQFLNNFLIPVFIYSLFIHLYLRYSTGIQCIHVCHMTIPVPLASHVATRWLTDIRSFSRSSQINAAMEFNTDDMVLQGQRPMVKGQSQIDMYKICTVGLSSVNNLRMLWCWTVKGQRSKVKSICIKYVLLAYQESTTWECYALCQMSKCEETC